LEPSITPTSEPSATRTIRPTLTASPNIFLEGFYDDFDTQSLNTYWVISTTDVSKSKITQNEGMVVFEVDGNQSSDINLIQARGTLDTLISYESSIKIGKSPRGIMGPYIQFSQGYVGCFLYNGFEYEFQCYMHPRVGDTQILKEKQITPGLWHDIRIVISSLNPLTFNFFFDQEHFFQFIPPQAQAFDLDISSVGIQFDTYAAEGTLNYGYIDYVSIETLE
jgi:hypothetical protein